ncbi:MAG: type I restriction-modification system subunit M N-terminal domain-containing protein [Xanthomonadales bacterium]|nr:type I restriction-modification system subunit M N-terminal domain-containing protein [Xanthomonadales bacterium]
MTSNEEQLFLQQLDKKLWTAADKLRSSLDASQYKHAVLGLIFLKYVSDSFDIRRQQFSGQFTDKNNNKSDSFSFSIPQLVAKLFRN